MARIKKPEVEDFIVTIRDQRVILAHDLARIYGVQTRVLMQAVKRHPERFPPDFAVRLTAKQAGSQLRSRSQSVILKRGENVKHPAMAFTEHGALMVASVLNSPQAVQMSLFVVRAFLRLRSWVAGRTGLVDRLDKLEQRVGEHDHELGSIISALRAMVVPPERQRKRIGFKC